MSEGGSHVVLIIDLDAPQEEVVCDALGCGEGLEGGELAGVDCADEVLAQPQVVDGKVHPEQGDQDLQGCQALALVTWAGLSLGRLWCQ